MNPQRVSVHVDGLAHGGIPIPTASRVGTLIATGGIRGVDRRTGSMPDDPAEQVRLMFDNVAAVVEAAGGALGTILKMDVWVRDRSLRTHLDPLWVTAFPDPDSRPARHLQVVDLPAGMLIQCQVLALVVEEQTS